MSQEQDKRVKATRYEGGFWPTRQHNLLLHASLKEGERALDAWHEWKSVVDIDEIDGGSYLLLPLLYRNLANHGVNDPLTNRLKGIYRQTWYKNHIAFRKLAALLESFRDAGIETMILKGAALTLLYYNDHGVRPMADLDVLVPTKKVVAAVKLMNQLGWTTQNRLIETSLERHIFFAHAEGFSDATGQHIDLHWHAMPECCYANADDDFWEGAIPTSIYDAPTKVLNPTDQLFHVCVHGARGGVLKPLRWIADAVFILNSSQAEIDWKRMIDQAEKRQLGLILRDTLNYLRDVFDAPVPRSILERLQNRSASRIELLEYRSRSHPQLWSDWSRGPFQALWLLHFRYRWLLHNADSSDNYPGFLRFLQHYWEIEHLWQLPAYVFSKLAKRISKNMGWYRN